MEKGKEGGLILRKLYFSAEYMPQDSVTIMTPNDTIVVSSLDNLPDSIRALLPPEMLQGSPVQEPDPLQQMNWIIIALLGVVVIPYVIRFIWDTYKENKSKKIIASKGPEYDLILRYSHPYYRKLSGEKQMEFLRRTIRFIQSKKFEYVELKPDEKMPLLISAAAVQLTFGLEHYLLDHFNKIYVMERSYYYGLSGQAFEGHVNYNG